MALRSQWHAAHLLLCVVITHQTAHWAIEAVAGDERSAIYSERIHLRFVGAGLLRKQHYKYAVRVYVGLSRYTYTRSESTTGPSKPRVRRAFDPSRDSPTLFPSTYLQNHHRPTCSRTHRPCAEPQAHGIRGEECSCIT